MASYCEKIDVVVISDSDSDSDSGSASASAQVQALFDDSGEELQKLQQYDTSCQNQRKKTKEAMTIQKAIAAREKAAQAKLTLEEQENKAQAKLTKTKSTKAKTVKAKTKSTKAKTKSTKTVLSAGMKVNACWQGDDPDKGRWYNGEIVSVNDDAETAHVKFDDGDEDDSLSWNDIRIL